MISWGPFSATYMAESHDLPDPMKRVVLPPRRRFSAPPPKAGVPAPVAPVPVTAPVEIVPRLPTARPPIAPPPPAVAPPIPTQPKQEKTVPVSPPPGIAPISGISQASAFSSPPQKMLAGDEKIEKVAELEQEEHTDSEVVNYETLPERDAGFEENVESAAGRMNRIPVYLSLAASLIALGIQIWMLLSSHAAG